MAASVVQASHSLGRGTTRPRSPGPCLAPPAPGMLSSQSASPREELALLPHSLSCRCELRPLGAGRHSNCSGRSTHSIQCRRRSSRPCPQCRASRRSGQGQIRGRRLSSSRRACRPARRPRPKRRWSGCATSKDCRQGVGHTCTEGNRVASSRKTQSTGNTRPATESTPATSSAELLQSHMK